MVDITIQEMQSLLNRNNNVTLFLYKKDFIKSPIIVEMYEDHMMFFNDLEKILDVEYFKIQYLQYKEIFKICILKFTYEEYQVSLQIKKCLK